MLHPVFTAPVWPNNVDWAVSCSAGTLHTASFQLRTNVLYHPMLVLWDFKFSRRRIWSWESSGMYCRVALMMEAARPSETSVDIELIPRQYIPEDSELHILRRDNLKSHIVSDLSFKSRKSSSFPFPFVPLQRRGCLMAPWFL